MDLDLHRRRKHLSVIPNSRKELYPHDLSMYDMPPISAMPVTEFEELAVERLKLLRILEFASHKGYREFSTEYKNFVYEELHKENMKNFLKLIKSTGTEHPNELDYQARRVDNISHFILRLAYSKSNDLGHWFLNKELELFKLRFLELSPQSAKQFMEINRLHYNPISEEVRDELRNELMDSTGSFFVFDTTQFYKVCCTEVPNLVTNRTVFVKDGFAYVPGFEIVSCICTIFRAKVNEALAWGRRKLPFMHDERINDVLNHLHNIYTGFDYREQSGAVGEINLSHLNKYSKEHYPPCMRHLHDTLKIAHHLKHGSRLQFLVFLKAMGLSMEDCIRFWRDEFTKIMDGNKFDKQYTYSIKHVFGKVGRMQSYAPYNCTKIISLNIGPGEQHGCPFKHWDSANLKDKLSEYGINSKGAEEIITLKEKGHYQVACGKYFECAHSQGTNKVITHPNQYFEDSYNLINNLSEEEEEN